MDTPDYSDFDSEEETRTLQDTNEFQHDITPTKESNPYGNPRPDFSEVVDREELMNKIDSGEYSPLDLIRLSRLSYLKHANRYNIKNK